MTPTVRQTLQTESTAPPARVVVYICPTPGCGNYYASPRFRSDRADIASPQSQRSQNDGQMTDGPARVECPDCRTARGLTVKRVPYVVTAIVKLEDVLKELA